MSYKIYNTEHDQVRDAAAALEDLQSMPEDYAERLKAYVHGIAEDQPEVVLDQSDAPVTFLIDLSGSMRGYPIQRLVASLTRVCDALDDQGRSFEILGFTTASWKGGESRKTWLETRLPRNPGRLCDTLHIVFKDVDHTWADRRSALAYCLKEGLMKENIDGEALEWTAERLKKRGPAGNIIFISDGAPVDDSTLSVNPASYLQDHLDEVVAQIKATDIELIRVRLGVPTNRFPEDATSINVTDSNRSDLVCAALIKAVNLAV